MRAVRQGLPAHAEHAGALMVVDRQRRRPLEPSACRHAPAGLHRDEPELPARLAGRLALTTRLRERQRLVQHRGALLVATAKEVHERRAESRERPCEERRVADRARLRGRLAQARDAGLDGARGDRRAARLQLPLRRRPVTDRRAAALIALAHRPPHARIGRAAKLATEPPLARVGVLARGADVARARQAPHQQLVGGIVERVHGDRPGRERRGVERDAAGQRRERRVPQHGLAQTGDAPALDEQPRAEVGRGTGIDPLEQLAARKRRVWIAAAEGQHVDGRPRRQPELQRIAVQRTRHIERAPQLREAPAQRPERVGGVAEDQRGQLRPRHRPAGQHQIGEHGPRLVPPRRSDDQGIALDLRASDQADGERRHDVPIVNRSPLTSCAYPSTLRKEPKPPAQ